MEDNYQSNITVSRLAKECLMSSNYFIKYFKEVTNQRKLHVKEESMIYIKSHNFSSLIDGFWSISRGVIESEAGDFGQGFLMKDL